MNAKHCLWSVLGLSVFLVGCAGSSRATDFSAWGDDSPFRVTGPAAELVAADQPLMIKLWSVECLDPRAPEVLALCGQLPSGDVRQAATFDAEAIAGHLDALAARDQLVLRSTPMIVIAAGGGRAEIRITEAIDRPDLQEGIEPGEFLFPFEVGERFGLDAEIDSEGYIHLDLDYRLETLQGSVDEPLPSVMTTAISTSLQLASGQSAVLGGPRLIHKSPGRRPVESVLLLVVNVRAVESTPAADGTDRQASSE